MNYLRTLIFYIFYIIWIFFFALLIVPWAAFLPTKPKFRVLNIYNHVIMSWFRFCCRVKVQIDQRTSLPATPCIIVANHQSEWETLFLQLLKPPICTVLKRELLNIPVFGWALRATNPIALDRRQRTSALKKILQQGSLRLTQGFSILIFPQGTRVKIGQWRHFNKSAFMLACRQKVPIIPIAHNAGQCWGNNSSWLKRAGTINVVIGAAIDPFHKTVDELANEAEQWIKTQVDHIS